MGLAFKTSWTWALGSTLALCALAAPLAAQCIVENAGGSRSTSNRPADADVPAARFSPIARVNHILPRWICINAGYRVRLEGFSGNNPQSATRDSFLLTRLRVGVAIKPANWLRTYLELQDATVFRKNKPIGPPQQTTWDLRRAYVDLGDTERGHIALRVGRQDLNFGWGRLLGTSYWRNASRGYDAAMAVVNWKPARVSLFAASPVAAAANGLSHHQQGNNLHGIYSSLGKLIPGAVVEPYVLWRLSPGFRTEDGVPSRLDEKTGGVRFAGTAAGFDYDTEAVLQRGHVGNNGIRAWGLSVIAGYTFRSSTLKPRVFAKYDFASGDRNPNDGVRGTFDQIYPNIHDHHGLADQVAWQNLKNVRAGVRASLLPSWMLACAYNDWWLASAADGFYSASGAIVARDVKALSGTHIGREFDVQSSYRLDRHLEFGAGLGYVRWGDLVARALRTRYLIYPYVMVTYNLL
jgi:hypothetical protein